MAYHRCPVRALSFALSALALAACETPCVDADFDGLGAGCALGPDCDDTNAARGLDCVTVPPPDCEANPTATGCTCLPGTSTACFGGPPEAAGVGICDRGRAICSGGHWGLCEDAVLPRFETCDDLDQDCDGLVDEHVRSPCGGCSLGCVGGAWGDPFVRPEGDLALTASGELTLRRRSHASATVFVPNAGDSTLSRIDAASAREVARYRTGPEGVALEPSRAAVDWNGDAWVANRNFDGVSSITRVATDEARCVDRDADTRIATSTGAADLLDWGSDECVTLHAPVGGEREIARAMAIDGDRGLDGASGGNPWVGLHDGEAVVVLDAQLGTVDRRIETPGFQPYAAAFDPWGILWMIARDGLLARVDPSRGDEVTIREVPLTCWLLYSLAIDAEGELAMTGFSCDQVTRFSPRTGLFRSTPTRPSPRGIASDPSGATFWVVHTGGTLTQIASRTLTVERIAQLAAMDVVPVETIGVGVDSLGYVWAISRDGGPGGVGVATRFDVAMGVVDAQVPVGLAPHTQGDLTGASLFGEPEPMGSASHVFTGCAPETTRWGRVHVALEPGTHGGATIEVRHAARVEDLGAATYAALGTLPDESAPFTLALPEGGAIEVRVTLFVEGRIGAPRLSRLGVEWQCPGPG